MSKSQQFLEEHQIAHRIKQGRGQGVGKQYRPWINVQDVPSEGRSHRIYSQKTARIHHLLSDLELAVFLVFEWSSSTIDIREQFPLRRDDTQSIARENGLRHPNIRGIDQVMSSDFLVDIHLGSASQIAIQVKPLNALADNRVVEKLEIERRYWELKQIPWFLITESEINFVVKQNISWLYPAKADCLLKPELLEQLQPLQAVFNKSPNSNVIDLCKKIDSAYNLELGQTLRDVRVLTANGFLKFDIHRSFRTISASDLIFCPDSNLEILLDVANQ